MKFGRKWMAWALCAGLVLGCAGCQEDPEGSIVKHKDMDKLISQAAGSQAGRQDVVDLQADVAENYESYQAELADESLDVQISVDAQVQVPDVDKLSIYRVQQKKIDQELVDKVVAEFMPGETLYDGGVLSARTRREVEADIEYFRQDLARMEADMRESGEYTEEAIEDQIQAYQFDMEHLQEEYENAPDTIEWSAWPGDSQIKPLEDPTYMEEGVHAVTDGSDGLYKALYVQNSSGYSNKLVYGCNPAGCTNNGGLYVSQTYFRGYQNPYMVSTEKTVDAYWQEKGLEGHVLNDFNVDDNTTFEPAPGWTCDLTQEEAQAQAEALLEKLGFEDFSLGDGALCSETLSLVNPEARGEKESIPFATYYILQYYRDIDGVLLTQSSGVKYQDGWTDEGVFRKELWPGECIEFRINDSGIVGFSVLAPVEVTETVVEGAALMPFDEVKGTFESMAAMVRAREYEQVAGEVDKVQLSYSRISEKDSFDTGLIVPVWSFEGKEDYYMNERLDGSWAGPLMAINAVDGSVIDAELGY